MSIGPRTIGDAVVAAFFGDDKPRARETSRQQLSIWSGREASFFWPKFREFALKLDENSGSIRPFHWEIEFPEIFERENPGFDTIVGNPPFLGGTRISTMQGMNYFQWLTTNYARCGHLCDLVAYFFRRSFSLIRDGGTFGLVATNTIAQGDTREGGLRAIIEQGGQIFNATRRLKWPGSAAVVVSVVHIVKNYVSTKVILDGKKSRTNKRFSNTR